MKQIWKYKIRMLWIKKTLEEYGKRYFHETLCDMIEESLEIDVVGQADQPVHMFDIVSLFHEIYNVDLRKKITKYKFNPMSIKTCQHRIW